MKISIFPLIVKKIKQCLAINQDGATADRNIASGKYVCWKGNMYTANSAINSGDTLATGSGGNLTAVSDGVANALNSNITTLSSNVESRIKRITFSMTASEVKSITNLPSRYMLFARGTTTSQLGVWVGTGYGSTAQRHILKEISGNNALAISVTVGSSVYGLNITNSSSGITDFTLVDMT